MHVQSAFTQMHTELSGLRSFLPGVLAMEGLVASALTCWAILLPQFPLIKWMYSHVKINAFWVQDAWSRSWLCSERLGCMDAAAVRRLLWDRSCLGTVNVLQELGLLLLAALALTHFQYFHCGPGNGTGVLVWGHAVTEVFLLKSINQPEFWGRI